MNDLEFKEGLPASLDAERTILGAVLLDSAAFTEASAYLRPDDFAHNAHQRIFTRMGAMVAAGKPVDLVTLSEDLHKSKELGAVGGVAYLSSLTEGLPRNLEVREYCNIVRDKSMLRRVILVASDAITLAADQTEAAESVLHRVTSDLTAVLDGAKNQSEMQWIGNYLDEEDPMQPRERGVPTGLRRWDDITDGLHKDELTVIAARPGMGKTALAVQLTQNLAFAGRTVGLFINEQRKKSAMGRMLCQRSGAWFERYRKNELSAVEQQYVRDAIKDFRSAPIFWNDESQITVPGMRAAIARMQRKGMNVEAVIVDQLSHIPDDGFRREGMRGDQILGAKVLSIKRMAQDLHVPVILFHQLNRETESSADKKPTLKSLKNSGEIEEHADNVAFLFRESYYDPDKEDGETRAEIIQAKQRDGRIGTAKVAYQPECCRWRDED